MNESVTLTESNETSGHGGKRSGAGRKPWDSSDRYKWFEARGIEAVHAGEILAKVGKELATWKRLINSDDDRIVLDAMKFLVSMRDGRPAQQINVTSQSLVITASEAEKARAIVRELMSPQSQVEIGRGLESPIVADAQVAIDSEGTVGEYVTGEEMANRTPNVSPGRRGQ